MIRVSRILPLVLALVLQAAPILRSIVPALTALSSPAGIILKWTVAAIALQGATHAVSGASTTIGSPSTATGTVGTTFKYSITLTGDSANKWTWVAQAGSSLAPGLALNNLGQIRGTPTAPGTFLTTITAMDVNADGSLKTDGGKPRLTSKSLTITINGVNAAPSFTADLTGATVTEGQAQTFTVTVAGFPTPTLQWFHGANPIVGQTGSTLTLNPVAKADQGTYFVRATNSQGTKDSAVVNLTVNTAPTFSQQPSGATVTEGGSVSFTAVPAGDPAPTLQWFHGTSLLPGKTGNTLTLNPVVKADEGTYFARAVNVAGSKDSTVVTLVVNPVKPVVQPFQLSRPIQAAGQVQFTFPGVVGASYLVEFLNDMKDTVWKPLTNIPTVITAGPQIVIDPVAKSEKWYRVGSKP